MNTTQNDSPLSNLLLDAGRIGPAPTRSREVAVLLATIIVAAVLLGIAQPGAGIAAAAITVLIVVMAVRWAVGTRKWASR